LDELDRELERRGHRFVRYADDCNIYVRSLQAGERVLNSVTRFLSSRLQLSVNEAKSAVGRPWERTFLGFTFNRRLRRRVSPKAFDALKECIREKRSRTLGRRLQVVVDDLRTYLLGWKAYFGFAEVRSLFKELDSWIRRRLRCYLWKQWGRRGYRELRRRGVSRELAWNTAPGFLSGVVIAALVGWWTHEASQADIRLKEMTHEHEIVQTRYDQELKKLQQQTDELDKTGRRQIYSLEVVEKFVPYVADDPKRRKVALIALSELGQTQVAMKFSQLYPDEETKAAIDQIQSQAVSSNQATLPDPRKANIPGEKISKG
jgi:hypothetical protein